MAIIQIKPIVTTKWHGQKKEKSFTRPKVLQAFVNPETMTYRTGLEYEEVSDKYKIDGEPATEAAYYGSILKVDLSNQFLFGQPHPFWDAKMARLVLENKTIILNTNIPLEYIKYKFAKASDFVANSMREYEEGLYPEATHVIFSEEEEVEVVASKLLLVESVREKLAKLNMEQKLQLILLVSGKGEDFISAKNLKGKSENYVKVELEKLITGNTQEVLSFLKLGKEGLYHKAIVLEALQKNIFQKEGLKVLYHNSIVGQDINDASDYLADPVNQDFKFKVLEKLN